MGGIYWQCLPFGNRCQSACTAILMVMSPSLREARRIRTQHDIVAAALRLFTARGYAAVTVSEVAAAAGVGERTLYRYFAGKEELLFADDEVYRAELRSGIESQPPERAPFTCLHAASMHVARLLQDRQDEVRRRARVIASSDALSAREQAKHVAWASVLSDALAERGVGADDAALLGRITVACYDEALDRWLAEKSPTRTLGSELDAVFARLSRLVG